MVISAQSKLGISGPVVKLTYAVYRADANPVGRKGLYERRRN